LANPETNTSCIPIISKKSRSSGPWRPLSAKGERRTDGARGRHHPGLSAPGSS
jgi:hypothetical protein